MVFALPGQDEFTSQSQPGAININILVASFTYSVFKMQPSNYYYDMVLPTEVN